MSETATTIIKLLSALTSPKAAIKYISVAIFIVISWKYFSELAQFFGTPDENLSIVVLLVGIGLGSLIGQLITWICEIVWNAISQLIEAKHREEKLAEEKLEKERITIEKNENIIKRYHEAFAHFSWEQKEKMRVLTLRDITLDLSNDSFKALHENGYINALSQISRTTYLVKINPAIKKITSDTWASEIESHVDEFFFNMTPEKSKTLELLEYRDVEDDSVIDFDPNEAISGHWICIYKEGEDDCGYWLSFRSYYTDKFSERTGKTYQDETWIKKDRITMSSDDLETKLNA